MLKLPRCPYCGAEFLYSSVRKTLWGRRGVCPHCSRSFRMVRRGASALLCLAAGAVLVGLNCLFLTVPSVGLPFLMVMTAVGIVLVYGLFPFTVRYRKLLSRDGRKS